MKTLFKLVVVAALLGAAIAFLTSRRGKTVRSRVTGYARDAADLAGVPSFGRAQDVSISTQHPAEDDAIRSKIDETRRRLREQLDAQLAGRSEMTAA